MTPYRRPIPFLLKVLLILSLSACSGSNSPGWMSSALGMFSSSSTNGQFRAYDGTDNSRNLYARYELDWDGADEPAQTSGQSLSTVSSNLYPAGGVPVHLGTPGGGWQVYDTLGNNQGNHYLAGTTSASGNDFYGNFQDDFAATRIEVTVGSYTTQVSGHLIAFAEPITDPYDLSGLTQVGYHPLTISGTGGETQFVFDVSTSAPARSFKIGINAGNAAVNYLAFDAVLGAWRNSAGAGEWWNFRRDGSNRGRSGMKGAITNAPQAKWKKDIAGRVTWMALQPGGSQTLAIPAADYNAGGKEDLEHEWSIGGTLTDLGDTTELFVKPGHTVEKIADFNTDVLYPTLERVRCWSGGDNVFCAQFLCSAGSCGDEETGATFVDWLPYAPAEMYSGAPILADVHGTGDQWTVLFPWHELLFVDGTDTASAQNPYRVEYLDVQVDNGDDGKPVESGRVYGARYARNLNTQDPGTAEEIVIFGTMQNYVSVVGSNGAGGFERKWIHVISGAASNNKTIHRPPVHPLVDWNEDGEVDLFTNVFYGDTVSWGPGNHWYAFRRSAYTGTADSVNQDVFVKGLRDVTGDGQSEIFLIKNLPSGSTMPRFGELEIQTGGATPQVIWSNNDNREFATYDEPYLSPKETITYGGQGRFLEDVATGAIDGNGRIFLTRKILNAESNLIELEAFRVTGTTVVSLGTVQGPGLRVLGFRDDVSNGLLIETRSNESTASSVTMSGFTGVVEHSRRELENHVLPVAGSLEVGETPTVVVQGDGERVLALEYDDSTSTLQTRWTKRGYGNHNLIYDGVGRQGFTNVSLADLNGDTKLETVLVRESADGVAEVAAIQSDGTELWSSSFDLDGRPVEWNYQGVVLITPIHLRSPAKADLFVNIKRASQYWLVLVDGETGAQLWEKLEFIHQPTGSATTGIFRQAAGHYLATYDWDSDGLEEAIVHWTDSIYVIDGTAAGTDLKVAQQMDCFGFGSIPVVTHPWYPNSNVLLGGKVAKSVSDGFIYQMLVGKIVAQPGQWNGCTEKVYDAAKSVLQITDLSVIGQASSVQAVGDFDEDGDQDIVSLIDDDPDSENPFESQLAFNAQYQLSNQPRWQLEDTFQLSGQDVSAGKVSMAISADIDDDNRDEVLFTRGSTLYAYGINSNVFTEEWKWEECNDSGAPTSCDANKELSNPILADCDGDSEVEVVVSGLNGYVYCIDQQP